MNRPHRAWLVCLGGALTLLSTIGLGVNVFAVYQPEILALRHFTNAQGSLITTVRSLFILVALLTVNRVCARLGLRRTMTLGVLLIALSCFCFGLADSFPLYCHSAVTCLYFQNRRTSILQAHGSPYQNRRLFVHIFFPYSGK